MSNKSNNGGTGGIGFIGLLTIVLFTLKLLGKIDWSWIWVFSPIWISGLGIISFVFLFMIISVLFSKK